MTINVLETSELTAQFFITARHSSTHAPIVPIAASLDAPLPRGWVLAVTEDRIAVSRWDSAPDLAADRELTVASTHPVNNLVLHSATDDDPVPPADISDRLVATAVTLSAAAQAASAGPIELQADFGPVPMVATVDLFDQNGAPRVGRQVTLVGAGNPIQLAEAAPGIYSSNPQVWDHDHTVNELRVDGLPIRSIPIDFSEAETRVRVVDPT